ncbi:aminotransferase class V-fold PLP-dependent enzyme [candidate division KSB1 bacterium]|nr:aminotransferase class V-fold PLP-dependent enzyme [candidate division KSB1 bacterium]
MERRNFIKSLAALAGGMGWLANKRALAADLDHALSEISPESDLFWRVVKKQFLLPEDYAYFNTGGLGASPYCVLEETQAKMREMEIYPAPGHDQEMWAQVKSLAAGVLQAPSVSEVALTNSTTEGNAIIVNGLPLNKGDEIITSTHEHAGLAIPLLNRMQHHGLVLKTFEPDVESGLGNVERIARLITKRTRLIFISHITCTLGQRFPEREIADLAHSKNIWFALDGAQVAGNMPIDVSHYDCDFYATGGHKWVLGPKRTGFLYVRESLLDTLRPITVGAYSDGGHDLKKKTFALNPTAQRYEYATQNSALYYGLGKAFEFINRIGIDRIWRHNKELAEFFYAGLEKIAGVRILSPLEKEYRSSLITFKIQDKNFREVANYLTAEKQLRVRVVPEAQIDGIRVSIHLYNDMEQIERLLFEIKNAANA